jgi:N-acetylneuraminic acid mutarotase
MVKPRIFAQSVLLPDGRALVIGGINLEDTIGAGPNRRMSASVEIYDPTSNEWTAVADLSHARYGHSATLLVDGRVLVAGGARDWDCCLSDSSFVPEIEIYDPGADRWHAAGTLSLPAANAAAVLLSDGRVWVTGGQAGEFNAVFHSETWLVSSVSNQP